MRRVLPYLKLARDRGAITDEDAASVEAVIGRLTELVPDEPPARLHGDLWNGNCLWGQDLAIHVIDPAAHGGSVRSTWRCCTCSGSPTCRG